MLFEVFQVLSAVGDHADESAAGVIVFRILFQMLRQFLDFLGEDGNLHFRGAGIGVVAGHFLDDFLFFRLR